MTPTTDTQQPHHDQHAVLAVDFETFYDKEYSLKKMDAWSYVHHLKFDAYLMSIYGCVPECSVGSISQSQGGAGSPSTLAPAKVPTSDLCSPTSDLCSPSSENGTLFRWVGHPKDFDQWHLFENATLLAHNAAFDSLVFKRLQELNIIPAVFGGAGAPSTLDPDLSSDPQGRARPSGPSLPSFQFQISSFKSPTWRCTASLAVYLQAPRNLKGACKQLLGIDVDKTQRSKACGQSTSALFDDDAMTDYALEDARLCFLLWEKHHHLWPLDEQELATLTFQWGQTGIGVDLQALDKCIQGLEQQRFDAAQLLPWVDDFTVDTPLSRRLLALECRKADIPAPASLAMDSPLCEAWEIKYGAEYPWVHAMRIFRRTNMLLSRFYTVRNRAVPHSNTPILQHPNLKGGAGSSSALDPAGRAMSPTEPSEPAPSTSQVSSFQFPVSNHRFPYGMKYFGAAPGRWSGDSGFNVQNMPRGEMFGADLRKCFQPAEGCVFVISDLSQIEPRILAWLIDDLQFLSLVRKGVDIYEAHARSTMEYADPAPLKEKDPALRSLAKARVLGLGYGCGPKKFVTVAKNLGGLEISFAQAKQTVAEFRSKNPAISRLWKRLDRDFKRSAGENYSIELPSGRLLQYFDVRKTPRGYYAAKTVRGGRERSLYGGLLCENLVQATARDLFAWQLLRIHRFLTGSAIHERNSSGPAADPQSEPSFPVLRSQTSGLCPAPRGRVVFHVHDEVIVETPREQADDVMKQIVSIMRTTPDWLSGCPVDAKAGIFTHYTK